MAELYRMLTEETEDAKSLDNSWA